MAASLKCFTDFDSLTLGQKLLMSTFILTLQLAYGTLTTSAALPLALLVNTVEE